MININSLHDNLIDSIKSSFAPKLQSLKTTIEAAAFFTRLKISPQYHPYRNVELWEAELDWLEKTQQELIEQVKTSLPKTQSTEELNGPSGEKFYKYPYPAIKKLSHQEMAWNAATVSSADNEINLREVIKSKCGFEPNFKQELDNYILIGYLESGDEVFDPKRFGRMSLS